MQGTHGSKRLSAFGLAVCVAARVSFAWGGVGMFDSALAFFEEGSLLVWAVRRSRVSLAFGIA